MSRRNTFELIRGDCLDVMESIPDGSIGLTVTSPPYDNLRSYNGVGDAWCETVWASVIQGLFRVTKPGGVVVWIVNDATIKGSETGTSFRQALHAMDCGFNLHDTMIWEKQTFTDTGSLKVRYGGVSEYMFVFSKGRVATFNPLKDRPTKGKTTKSGGIRQRDGSTVPQSSLGKIYDAAFAQRFNVWRINTECSNTKRSHPAQFPEQIASDHIVSWSGTGDTVFDPFMGSGTTGAACANLGRSFIGIELNDTYFEIAKSRVNAARMLFVLG